MSEEGGDKKGLRNPGRARLIAGSLIEGQKELGHLAKAKFHEVLGKALGGDEDQERKAKLARTKADIADERGLTMSSLADKKLENRDKRAQEEADARLEKAKRQQRNS